MFEIIVALSLGYEYYRREKRHKLVIESLKQGTLPDVAVQKEEMLGIVTTMVLTILYIGFLLFLTFFLFFSRKMHLPFIISSLFLIPWYGIGVMLVLITKRNINARRKKLTTVSEVLK